MALQVREDVSVKYRDFYKLVGGACDGALVLENITDDDAAAITDFTATKIILKNSPLLTKLDFLSAFKCLEEISLIKCKNLTKLWDLSENDSLHSLAITACVKLCDIEALRYGGDLEHFFFDNVWGFKKMKSFVPLKAHTGLKTLDLACKAERDAGKIDFNAAWPSLESFTISPVLKNHFITAAEVKH
ncbi:MAG: hypothetical protein RSD78_03250 [Oscillospiraceae bacterium]